MARRRHAVSAEGLEGAAEDSTGHDDELRRTGGEDRPAQSHPRRRPCQRLQSDQRGRALSPPDRRQRFADQIWRRTGAETLAAAARGRGGLKRCALLTLPWRDPGGGGSTRVQRAAGWGESLS